MSFCMYLRKSRADLEAEARGEGETLARHERVLIELAKRQNMNITQIYKEIVSGDTIAARPVMQRLLTEVEQGLWDGVIAIDIDRLSRGSTIDQGIVAQTFKYRNTKIITPAKTYDPNNEFDEEYFEFGLFMSRREYKTINRRLQNGRIASVKEGKYLAKAPYGYTKIKLEKEKGYTLAPVPEEADVIKLIFSMYVNGEKDENGSQRRFGIQMIARRLNQLRIPPIRRDSWQKETIRDILINPVYIGKVRWKWRPNKKKMVDGKFVTERPRNYGDDCILADALHPAIVDKEIFETAQKYIESSPPAPIGYKSTLKNPLAGLIVCGKCGRKMVLRKGYNRPDYIICHAKSCDNVSSPFNLVESRILSSLNQWLGDYKAKWNSSKKNNSNLSESSIQKALKKLESDLAVLNKQLNSTYDLLEQGIYAAEQFLDRSRSLTERIEQLKKDYNILEKELNLETARDESRRTIVPKIEKLLDIYKSLPAAEDKNNMLKEVLEKAVYTKTKSGMYRGISPDEFTLVLYPKLPKSDNSKLY